MCDVHALGALCTNAPFVTCVGLPPIYNPHGGYRIADEIFLCAHCGSGQIEAIYARGGFIGGGGGYKWGGVISGGRFRRKNYKEEPPPPPPWVQPPPSSKSPEKSSLRHLWRECTVCSPGSCSGCEFTLNSISMNMDCHELILSCCGHRICYKCIALSLPCTVTFADKEEGQPSMGFCYAKKNPNMFGSPVASSACLGTRHFTVVCVCVCVSTG